MSSNKCFCLYVRAFLAADAALTRSVSGTFLDKHVATTSLLNHDAISEVLCNYGVRRKF